MIGAKFAAENCAWCQERNPKNVTGLTAVYLMGLDKKECPSVRSKAGRRRSEAQSSQLHRDVVLFS